MTDEDRQFLVKAESEAFKAHCKWPKMWACEAALESHYGRSALAMDDNNLFGMKLHSHNQYGEVTLPTNEFQNSTWVHVDAAKWEKYPDWSSCFADRFSSLLRLASFYPHYAAALTAKDPQTYVTEVSQTWSTDPGWLCSCGNKFSSRASAQQHAVSAGHSFQMIPGLGRALKVLVIYDLWLAVDDLARPGAD